MFFSSSVIIFIKADVKKPDTDKIKPKEEPKQVVICLYL